MKILIMAFIQFIKEQIKTIKENDPAIKSTFEVFLYPSFKAIIYYKISHYFYEKNHFLIAKYISEKAKRKTGIEIHPRCKNRKRLIYRPWNRSSNRRNCNSRR